LLQEVDVWGWELVWNFLLVKYGHFPGTGFGQSNIESVASLGAPYFVISFIAISRGFCGHDSIAALTELLLTWTDDMLDGFSCATAKKKRYL
jgi:hypothetical protein